MDKHRLKIVRITNGCRNISELGGKRSDFVKPVLALGTNRTLQDVMSGFPAPWASHPCSVYFVLGEKMLSWEFSPKSMLNQIILLGFFYELKDANLHKISAHKLVILSKAGNNPLVPTKSCGK